MVVEIMKVLTRFLRHFGSSSCVGNLVAMPAVSSFAEGPSGPVQTGRGCIEKNVLNSHGATYAGSNAERLKRFTREEFGKLMVNVQTPVWSRHRRDSLLHGASCQWAHA